MDAVLVVAAIVGAFFVVGLVVGGTVVLALPVLRGRRRREQDPVPPQYDRVGQDERPRWPGHDDNGR